MSFEFKQQHKTLKNGSNQLNIKQWDVIFIDSFNYLIKAVKKILYVTNLFDSSKECLTVFRTYLCKFN